MSKLDRSRLAKPLQPLNILSISVTLEVSKLDKSRLIRLLQSENIASISVTLEVSKPDKSRLVRLLQPENILIMYLTPEVSKQFPKLIFSRLRKSEKSLRALLPGAIFPLAATYRSPLSIHASMLLSLFSDMSQASLGAFRRELWKVTVFTSPRVYCSCPQKGRSSLLSKGE